ncbi:MFS general substrate transporter [Xylona heveae TC161]|uniref:MFS general substrate transporter n=1 Tax=Xylona heveae (strain CBS 132557 / TC161) TaxID=1328760 RepID=A0A165GST3_XYLHT|nr:MFS general substrate transporter [Xylona heveae TC161]KZF22553.1 MFS general substrate transporter [Xylona heveae TC161]
MHSDEEEEKKSVWQLFLLTVCIGGLQIAWTVELSNGSPFLLSLGISKSIMALVWIAGPLSGSLVQPYVGMRSDNSRISWGKRRPFMIGGTIATIISLLLLAWTKEIIQGLVRVTGGDPNSRGTQIGAIVFAVCFIYILDFAVNVVQAAIRAFIVDNAPSHQQETANAWAGRMTGVGNVLGYLSGYVNLRKAFPFFGQTQFQILCVIACLALGVSVALSSVSIKERDPRLEGPAPKGQAGLIAFFRRILVSIKRLPPQIRNICLVQFFAWVGWFPFLFYITTYIGGLYTDPIFRSNPHLTDDDINKAWEKATRVGTFALFVFACVSLAANVVLPFIIPWLTLRRAWLLSHVLFTVCMWLTLAVSTPTGATVLVGVVGICWALTLWAPFALISAEIAKRETLRRSQLRRLSGGRGGSHGQGSDESEDQAGIILGLHNVAMCAPQVIATVASSFIFRFLQKPRGVPGDGSVAWVLRIGGLSALIAAYMVTRINEDKSSMVPASSSSSDEEDIV